MSVWNIRIMASEFHDGEVQLFPAEVHYHGDDVTKPRAWVEHEPHGETLDDLRFYANEMLKACEQPILSAHKFPEEFKR
jgi:hypothetical protein